MKVLRSPGAVIVESGNLSDLPEKLDLVTSVLSELHYDAIGIGATDLSMSEEFFKRVSANKLTVLDASAGSRAGLRRLAQFSIGRPADSGILAALHRRWAFVIAPQPR
jgi:hypothetical protein